jgi:hypothetical protein
LWAEIVVTSETDGIISSQFDDICMTHRAGYDGVEIFKERQTGWPSAYLLLRLSGNSIIETGTTEEWALI